MTEVGLVELPPPTKIHRSSDVGKQESDRCIPESPAAGVPELEEVRRFLNGRVITAAPFLTAFLNDFTAFFAAWVVLEAVEISEGERRVDDEGMGKGGRSCRAELRKREQII